MSGILSQEEVDALLNAVADDYSWAEGEPYTRPILKHGVLVNGKVYCWDATHSKYVEARLEAVPDAPVPVEAIKQIAIKWFGLTEPKTQIHKGNKRK